MPDADRHHDESKPGRWAAKSLIAKTAALFVVGVLGTLGGCSAKGSPPGGGELEPDATDNTDTATTDTGTSGFDVPAEGPDADPGGPPATCEEAKARKSSVGCDYFILAPDAISVAQGGCFAAFVANTGENPVTMELRRGSSKLDVKGSARITTGSGKSIKYSSLPGGQLPPGQVAILFLSRVGSLLVNCPEGVTPAVTGADPAIHGTGKGEAFHLTTSTPVVVYDIYPYGGGGAAATGASLLLPTTTWDTNYVAVDAYDQKATNQFKTFTAIVAAESGTTVTIKPSADIEGGGGVASATKGKPHTYSLSAGHVLQFTQSTELLGSIITSNKPIGVWGGADCINIPVGVYACDTSHQQIPPVRALGHEYVAVRHRDRIDGKEESPPWRIVGAVAGTSLTYEPSTPTGAPKSIGVGQLAVFRAPGPFVVRSQDESHPFYVSGHMTGGSEFGGAGDPEFVNVVPTKQYLKKYIFFTDPTYPETNLVFVRAKGSDSAFKDVNLDCAGSVSGWKNVGANYQYARVDLVRHDFAKQGKCDNGRHEAKSDGPFALTVWGWGTSETGGFFSQYVSYAYPASAGVGSINAVTVK